MKRISTLVAMAFAVFTQSVADDNINLGYTNNGTVASTATFTSEGDNEVSAAIFLPASVLKGYQGNAINGVRAGIAARNNLEQLTVWVRKSLDGENLASGQTDTPSRRWNEVTLDTPYNIIGDEGLYIGYTAKHFDDASIVATADTVVAGSFFYQAQKGAEWQDQHPFGRVALEAVISGSQLPAQDLQLITAQASLNQETGKIDITATLRNNGTAAVSGFALSWFDEKTNLVGQQAFAENVAAGGKAQVSLSVDVTDNVKDVIGITDDLFVSVALAEGTDPAEGNNTLPALFKYARKVLVEEYTGESCDNCPVAAETIEKFLSNPYYASHVAVISRHWGYNNDSYTLQGDKDHESELIWYFAQDGGQGAPAFSFDRYPFFFEESRVHPGTILQSAVHIGSDLSVDDCQLYTDTRLAIPANAALLLDADYDATTRLLKINVTGKRNGRLSNKPSHITVVVTENNVKAVRQYYSSTEWFDEYYHQHCYRWYNELWGEEIEWDGLTFQKQWEVTLGDTWKPEDVSVVAYISEYDSESPLKMEVNNVADMSIKSILPTAITEVGSDNTKAQGQTFNLKGQRVDASAKGLLIRNGKKFIQH